MNRSLLIIFLLIMTALGIKEVDGGNSELKKEIDNYLKKTFSQYESYEFEILQTPEGKNISLVQKSGLNLHKNLLYLPVEITDKYNRKRNSNITLKIKLYKNILVVKNQIVKKHILSEADIEIVKFNVTEIKGTPFTEFEDISKYQTKINIRPETVLIKEMTEPKPIINDGDKISARIIKGKVMLSVDALSRQDGAEGDIIKITTLDKKQFSAKVVDSKNVLIIE